MLVILHTPTPRLPIRRRSARTLRAVSSDSLRGLSCGLVRGRTAGSGGRRETPRWSGSTPGGPTRTRTVSDLESV
jgi:hypothetical protein